MVPTTQPLTTQVQGINVDPTTVGGGINSAIIGGVAGSVAAAIAAVVVIFVVIFFRRQQG